ncbi:hypothetical protein HCUR_00970 [Holospora curviuscula]|uniref:Uncharacterized protein n=1 Tax=Holospora curviuscula TaxID=1082868 RepID=A0A2S5R8C8_9PROT|nr:hypothetical protein HCUR_00970 [Holospora curviuscula]
MLCFRAIKSFYVRSMGILFEFSDSLKLEALTFRLTTLEMRKDFAKFRGTKHIFGFF